jgi:hypothetical protein
MCLQPEKIRRERPMGVSIGYMKFGSWPKAQFFLANREKLGLGDEEDGDRPAAAAGGAA